MNQMGLASFYEITSEIEGAAGVRGGAARDGGKGGRRGGADGGGLQGSVGHCRVWGK